MQSGFTHNCEYTVYNTIQRDKQPEEASTICISHTPFGLSVLDSAKYPELISCANNTFISNNLLYPQAILEY